MDLIIPHGVRDAVQRLLGARNAAAGFTGRDRFYPRDIYEAAITDLAQRLATGERVIFRAVPLDNSAKQTIWLDKAVRAQAADLASKNSVTVKSFALTAFCLYVDAHAEHHRAA